MYFFWSGVFRSARGLAHAGGTRQRPSRDRVADPRHHAFFSLIISLESIAASDPYTAAGFCAFELLEWEVHQIMGAGPFTAAEMRSRR
jgi:hypothetical protein